jgi:ATP-dependent helicase/nuclease subunit B
MTNFLQRCAHKIFTKHGANLSRVLVLMPNQRSCTYFKHELKQLAKTAIFAPEVSTLHNWALSHTDFLMTDNLELVLAMHDCHRELGGLLPLDDFFATANVLLADFDELDLQLVDPSAFFRDLEALQSMKIYEPGGEPTEYKLQYRKFWEDFGALYHALRERLVGNRKGYRGLVLRQLVEEEASSFKYDVDAVYLIGFSGLNKIDESLINLLKVNATTEILFDADPFYVKDELKEAGYYFRKYWKLFQVTDKALVPQIETGDKKISIVGVAKNIGQVKVLSDVLKHKLRVTKENALDTVIVMPDEKLLSPLLANMPIEITSLNITMGLNITGSRTATLFETLFNLQESSQKYLAANGRLRYYYKDVFDLLQHSFFKLLVGEVNVAKFVHRMKRQNRVMISAEEIHAACANKSHEFFFEGNTAEQFLTYWANLADSLLTKLIQQVRNKQLQFSTDTEIAFRLLNIFNHVKPIVATGESISVKTLVAILRDQFKSERVPIEGDPIEGLQIMGLQETRSLNFKHVIFLSANEGILPGGKHTNTYIPYEMRQQYLSTYKDRDAVSAYLFYRLFHQAETVHILYNTEPDELGGGEKSRFVLQLQHEFRYLPNVTIEDSIYAVDPPDGVFEQKIEIAKDEAVMQKLDKLITESGLSPSSLNAYINCSLQFYFRYIAGLREEEDMEENLESATIGSAVHYALEEIYKPMLSQVVNVDYLQEILTSKNVVQDHIATFLTKRFEQESLRKGKNYLLYKVCVKLTQNFLKAEVNRLKELNDAGVDMRIEQLEDKLESSITVGRKTIKLNGRIDRIERIDHVVQIADYKTSKLSTIPQLKDEVWETLLQDPKYSKSVQLLIYALLYSNIHGHAQPIRSGIYWLRDSSKAFDTVRQSGNEDKLDAITIQRFEGLLKGLLTEMIDDQIPFTKTEEVKRCQYCEFVNICGRAN